MEERRKTARAWYQILKNALEKAMSSDPEILFVAAAGNSNSDSSFNETVKAISSNPPLLAELEQTVSLILQTLAGSNLCRSPARRS